MSIYTLLHAVPITLRLSKIFQAGYHDSSEETHGPAAAGGGSHIPIAHCEKGDGYEPQSRVHVAGGYLCLPAGGER